MAVHINSEDAKSLRKFIPLGAYPRAAFEELCTNLNVEQVRDEFIVKRGDQNTELVYLLTGSVNLQADELVIETIEAGTDSAKFALAHQIPRKIDVFANGLVRIVRLDADLINHPPSVEYKENDSYTIVEESDAEADDWLNVLLRIPLFESFAPAQLQKLLISIKTVQFFEGDVIIENGAEVEHFYIIVKGQCAAIRPGLTGSIEKKLNVGDTFGEDPLIMGVLSKERVSAITGSVVIKLARNQFVALITRPLIQFISSDKVPDLIHDGIMLIDVRSKQLAEKNPLEMGVNIPYLNLLNKINDLDVERTVITYADEKTSQAAAFLLLKHKFKVYALSDGSVSPEPEIEIKIEKSELRFVPEETVKSNLTNEIIGQTNDKFHQPNLRVLEPEAELKYLRAENQRLNLYVRDLEENITHLKIEKQKLSMRTELLALQLKKLKEFLVKYKNKQSL